jgi:putative peptide zinc metalloprotease protein
MELVAMSTAADAPLFSPYWYKVARLSPRLKPGVRIQRRLEQGEVWHILSAPESNRHFRLDQASYAIIGALDGTRTLEAIWRHVLERFGDAAPGQDETLRLLGQLHQADALNSGVSPTLAELDMRARRAARQKLIQKLKSPLFIRVPLFDPQRLIAVTYPLVRPFFSFPGLLLWAVVVIWLGVQAVTHWGTLKGSILDQALAVENLLIAALVFPFAKALHELAHGWAVHHWGGEVRETGIMFLVFLPAPYVDASAAAAFPSRRARVVVGAAGMMMELALAAGAMAIWLQVETGFLSALAFNMMLIAGISTLLFNGNPLLRFDAYFILSDLIGVQNLAGRAQKWWGWLLHRYGYGAESWENPARTRAEVGWFAFYHPVSYVYRVFLTLSIALFVAQEYRALGLALAIWSVATTIALPAAQAVWHLMTAPALTTFRARALGVSMALVGLPVLALLAVPLPHGTVAPGVVVAPDTAYLTAPLDAEIAQFTARSGQNVAADVPLVTLHARFSDFERARLMARRDTTLARLRALEADGTRPDEAQIMRARLTYHEEELRDLDAQLQRLTLTAPAGGGVFLLTGPDILPGRRLAKGREVGLVVQARDHARLRVAIPAGRIDLFTTPPSHVALFLPGQGYSPYDARLVAIAPEATRSVDDPAFSSTAGGPLPMDPSDERGQRSARPFHLAEVATDIPLQNMAVGALVWLRFDHGAQPLAPRMWRALRQTFLSRLAL